MRVRRFVCHLAVSLIACFAVPVALAEQAGTPSAFVTELAHKAPVFLSSRALSSVDRQKRVEGLLEEYFDLPRIASFVLGKHWKEANDADRQKFTLVLRDVLARTYSDRFTRYSVESFRVTSQRELDAANTVVYSEIGDPALGEQAKVEWYVARRGGYRIFDMGIAGISMAKIMHDDFGSYLKRNSGGLPDLIRQLRAKLIAEQPG